MKTPSLLLLAVLAVVPAFSESATLPARCDEAWLKEARADVARPGTLPKDPDGRTTTANSSVRLKFGHDKLCQQSVWLFLGEARQKSWGEGDIVSQIDQLLAVSALYAGIDPKALDAIDKAEAVLRAAESLGAVRILSIEKAAGPFADRQGYHVAAVAPRDAAPKIKPEEFGAVLPQLIVDVRVKGAEPKQALGPMVIAFRKSVSALHAELAKGVASKAIPFASALHAAGDDAWLQDDKNFHLIAAQTGGEGSILSPIDLAVGTLVAMRVAEVDRAVESLRKQMDGKSVRAVLAAARLPAAYGADAPKAGTLAADVARRLGSLKDYQDLDAMFEAKQGQPGYIADPAQRKAVGDRLAQMRSDAGAAAIVDTPKGKHIEFSVGGQKRSVALVVDLDKPAYREQVTSYLAERLAQNPLDAKVQAALASFRGVGDSGGNLSSVDREQADLAAGKLPKPPERTLDPTTPFGKIATSKDANCGSPADLGKGTMERYSTKKRAALAAEAGANSRRRQALQAELDVKLSVIENACRQKEAAIMARPRDPDDDDNADKARRAQEVVQLRKDCDAQGDAAQAAVLASAKEVLSTKDEDARLKKGQARLDEDIDAAFSDGIVQSVDELRKAYKEPGSSRRRAAESASGYSGSYYRIDRVDRYFDTEWDGAKLKPSIEDCKKKLGFEKGKFSGYKDPSADNLDKSELCGVRDGLVKHLKSYRGTVSVPGDAAAVTKPSSEPIAIPAQPQKRRSLDEMLGGGK